MTYHKIGENKRKRGNRTYKFKVYKSDIMTDDLMLELRVYSNEKFLGFIPYKTPIDSRTFRKSNIKEKNIHESFDYLTDKAERWYNNRSNLKGIV